jgi:hypothetical protein
MIIACDHHTFRAARARQRNTAVRVNATGTRSVVETSASLGGGRRVQSLAMQIETGQELTDVPTTCVQNRVCLIFG